MRAEAAAAAAREAALAEVRAIKELRAADEAADNNYGGFTERLLGGRGEETKSEEATGDGEQEEEEEARDGIKVCALPAA